MSFFENGLKAKVMSTELIIEANVSKRILFEALALAKEFESKYSAYKEDSLLCKINRFSGEKSVSCSKEELDIFIKALEIAKLSNGLFDPTIGVLTQGLYGFGTKEAKIPTAKELQKSKSLVNFKDVEISNNEIFLKQKGMRLDLGGIGKGYMADKIILFLKSKGATKALVSVGGEIVTFGKNYAIAVKNPFKNGNTGIIKSSKSELSISTSGDYERYIDSRDNHHILDNSTAKQKHFYSSITIIKDGVDATLLDGVATIAFNSKMSELKDISKQFGVAIIAISRDKEIYFESFSNLNIKNFEIYPFK